MNWLKHMIECAIAACAYCAMVRASDLDEAQSAADGERQPNDGPWGGL